VSISDVERMYSRMFSLPRLPKLVKFSVVLSFAFSLIIVLLFGNVTLMGVFTLMAFSILSIFVPSMLLSTMTRGEKFRMLDFRRSVAVFLISYTIASTLLVITLGLSCLFPSITIMCAYPFMTFFIATVVTIPCRSLSSLSWIHAAFLSLAQSLIYLPAVSWVLYADSSLPLVTLPLLLFKILVPLAVGLLFGYGLLACVGSFSKKSIGVDAVDLLRAALAEWMVHEPALMEKYLMMVAEEKTLPVGIFVFRRKADGRLKALLLVPYIHPGLYGNIGSSNMPFILSRSLEEKLGTRVLVLHGPSTHEYDLASRSEIKKIEEVVLSEVENINCHEVAFVPYTLKYKDFSYTSIGIGGSLLVIVTRAPRSMDDISLEAGLVASSGIRAIEDLIMVDAHNCIDERRLPVDVGSPEFFDILEGVRLLIGGKDRQVHEGSIMAGVSKLRNTGIPSEHGMGPDGVSAIAIAVGGKLLLIIVYDSNNLARGLRERIIDTVVTAAKEEIYSMGHKIDDIIVEVCTTDTHYTAGITQLSGQNYLGERGLHDEIVELAKRVALDAIKNLEEVKVGSKIVNVPRLKVLGKNFTLLLNLVTAGASAARYYSLFVLPVSMLVLMLLALI